jgi:hypothetical protein
MVAAERHHLRVWQTKQMVGGSPLWVGSATHDIGFAKDQRNGNVTHKIDPKIDDEREFLLLSFDAAGGVFQCGLCDSGESLAGGPNGYGRALSFGWADSGDGFEGKVWARVVGLRESGGTEGLGAFYAQGVGHRRWRSCRHG